MSPTSFDFGHAERVRQASKAVRRAVEDAVDTLSLSVAAAACKCTGAELHDAMTGRKGRRLPFEWVLAIAMVSAPSQRDRILAALLEEFGLVATAPKPLEGGGRP